MTTRANLYIDQGVDFLLRLNVILDENTTEGLTFYSSIRKVYSSVDKLFDATVLVDEVGIGPNGDNLSIILDFFVGAEKTRD